MRIRPSRNSQSASVEGLYAYNAGQTSFPSSIFLYLPLFYDIRLFICLKTDVVSTCKTKVEADLLKKQMKLRMMTDVIFSNL